MIILKNMNLYFNISDIKSNDGKSIDVCDNIRYLYPKKNTIMEGEFTKILYSKEYVTLNGLYIYIPFTIDKSSSDNHIRHINTNSNNLSIVNDLKTLEMNILNNFKTYSNKNKQLEHVIAKQLNTGCIRVYTENNKKNKHKYVIKISGIWETSNKIGLTYKILEL